MKPRLVGILQRVLREVELRGIRDAKVVFYARAAGGVQNDVAGVGDRKILCVNLPEIIKGHVLGARKAVRETNIKRSADVQLCGKAAAYSRVDVKVARNRP